MPKSAPKKGAGGAKPPAAFDLEQPNHITRDEAAHLLGIVHAEVTDHGHEQPVIALMLLLHYLAFEEDGQERFSVWYDARAMFALDMTEPYAALEKQLGVELTKLREGGAR